MEGNIAEGQKQIVREREREREREIQYADWISKDTQEPHPASRNLSSTGRSFVLLLRLFHLSRITSRYGGCRAVLIFRREPS
jgi:hypothetical protein